MLRFIPSFSEYTKQSLVRLTNWKTINIKMFILNRTMFFKFLVVMEQR